MVKNFTADSAADSIDTSQIIKQPYGCGITSFTTSTNFGADIEGDFDQSKNFWQILGQHCTNHKAEFVLLFFSSGKLIGEDIIANMASHCPDIAYAACSTAGEITPSGLKEGQLMALVFDQQHFTFSPLMLAPISTTPIDEIVATVRKTKEQFLKTRAEFNAANKVDTNTFALCLIDGLSYAEEGITAAFHWGLDEIPLLGGSTGDNLEFNDTSLILNGEEKRDSAILIMVATDVEFELFKSDNFVPTENKLVVTQSDPDKRIVYEFNAAPAAEEYAMAIGIEPGSLSPQSFASHPLVIRVGGEHYCRSIQKMNEDGSLTFFCAVDDGIVLRIAKPTGMIDSTNAVLERLQEKLGGIEMVLGFDCVLRKIDARNRQVTHKISKIYQQNNVVGFNTYGEQYRSMHLNQTLTGVAFSKAKRITPKPAE